MTHLSIIGAGKIGGEVAYLSTVMGIADELTMTDCNSSLLLAQQLDIIHTGIDISISTDKDDIKRSDIIIFSAGLPRNPDIKTRADLLDANIPVAEEFCKNLKGFDGIIISITNPVDALNYFICSKTEIDKSRCIGFGGQIDLARLNYFLKSRDLDTKNSFVIGEHGEHQVPLFSEIPDIIKNDVREEILAEMRGASMPVIKGKGGTVFGPVYNIIKLISAIKYDKKEIIPCSCIPNGEYGLKNLSIGLPVKIGKNGTEKIIEKNLDLWEAEKFKKAAEHLTDLCGRAYDDKRR